MAQIQKIPIGEQLDTVVKMIELEKQGKTEEAFALRKQIPLPAFLGEYAKEYLGLDWMKTCGWNMSEIEAKYGKGYITR